VSESMERAHETMEHHGSSHAEPSSRRVAVLISALAAVLALAGIGSKATQNAYLTHHVTLSDSYAFYQAKNVRATLKESEIAVLESLPNAEDPAIQNRIQAARVYAERMRDDPQGGDGMKQILVKAKEEEAERNEAFHRYHNFEFAVGALEIAIVLASVSVVTRMRPLALAAAAIGAGAAIASMCIAGGLL